ncbi:MAG: IPT/TIG domain-containing protein [Balneola sp.]
MRFKINTLLFLLLVFYITACDNTDSIFNPDYEPSKSNPVISNIFPEEGYLAGIDSIIIVGENFSDDVDELTINFSGEPGIVLSSTPDQIIARPARVVDDSVAVRVSSRGAVSFSNTYYYQLDEAIFPIGNGYNEFQNTLGITHDINGNIYFSLQNESGIAQGIKVLRPDSTVGDYLPSSVNWLALKYGPDNTIYGVRNNFGVYRESVGAIDTNPFAFGNSNEEFRNLDFGKDDFLWVVGDNENLFRVNIENGTIKRYPFEANLRAVRYFDDQLFVGGGFLDPVDSVFIQEVWRFDVNSSNDIVNNTKLFEINSTELANTQILDITFDIDGKLYFGANTGSGIYTWTSSLGVNEFYPGLILTTGFALTWLDNFLVASIKNIGETTRHPTRIDIRKNGAPYLGIQ